MKNREGKVELQKKNEHKTVLVEWRHFPALSSLSYVFFKTVPSIFSPFLRVIFLNSPRAMDLQLYCQLTRSRVFVNDCFQNF